MEPFTIASPETAGGLTLFPLVAPGPTAADYDLLPDALEAGSVVITEVSEAGVVPELVARNHGPRDVLILDGMQLIGAKQNRTVSRSILLAAGSSTRIPVSCMEQGRWRHRSAAMRSGLDHSSPKVRRRTRSVEASQANPASHQDGLQSPAELLAMAQGHVWEAIRESSAALHAPSATGAFDEVYDATRPRLETLAASFPLQEAQVGFVAFLRGTPIGADAVHGPGVYARLHDRLVRGYLLDALEAGAAGAPGGLGAPGKGASIESARSFLHTLDTAERRRLPTVGKGEYRALAGTVVGAELTAEDRVVHLSAFMVEGIV